VALWTSKAEQAPGAIFALEGEGHALAERLPDLVVEAQRVSLTVAHGVHGRRRAGPGENFWQFRQFQDSDTAAQIDWRRSATSDHLYIREREWEAAHTFWLWSDISPSMSFRSHLAEVSKRDRALVLTFALSEMLLRAGERVALIGLTTPSSSRKATTRMAELLAANGQNPIHTASLPPPARMSRFSSTVLFSDFLDPPETIVARIDELAASGVSGTLVQVLDPAEETLPYDGRTEFVAVEGNDRWIADRAETIRSAYVEKLAAHRAVLMDRARGLGWTFMVHHTDRPATEPLMALIMRLQGLASDYRWQSANESTAAGGPA
jgi:uncharacterized protein (DUF58 family)